MKNCGKCTNNCMLTITTFNDGREYISGNRCERGANLPLVSKKLPNLFDYKYRRVFNYRSLSEEEALRGMVGIPRALNMYENYPFWHTLLTELKFRVILSARSSKAIYEKGIESIPSESACYPAKITHGHIENLIEKGLHFIFYPSVAYERLENEEAGNHYNCPVVASYPEVIKNNVDSLDHNDICFKNPFVSLNNPKTLFHVLKEELKEFHVSDQELQIAIDKAYVELNRCQEDIRQEGLKAMEYMQEHHLQGIVLAGRPYHIDPEINHGIADLITSEGFVVLSEDSVCYLDQEHLKLRVVDQWTYHSRLYKAASYVSSRNDLQLIQLTSFGCGLDAVTADQVAEILKARNKIYTLIKIDEGSNLGAIRIRIRSLKATLEKKEEIINLNQKYEQIKVPFTKEMREARYTILCPQMSPLHFQFVETAMNSEGYNFVVLPSVDKDAVEQGLKYVNNDACYPSILVTGQMMNALNSGKYDLNKVALMISQTGGGCRATNYIAFIRKALKDAGFGNIPVISFNIVGMEKMPGFKLTPELLEKLIKCVLYGDLLQKMLTRNRAYEVHKGETKKLFDTWMEKCKKLIVKCTNKEFKQSIYDIVNDFEKIELDMSTPKPRVGIVGEVLIKYHPYGNNYVADLLEKEGAEVILPEFMGFVKFMATHKITFNTLLNTNKTSAKISKIAIKLIDLLEKDVKIALSNSKKGYMMPCDIWHLEEQVKDVLSIGNQTGEGWFLTAEMIEYIENNIPNIVCVQPFACLPNHVVGKGVIKTIREKYPDANISPVDYDPGASEVNQANRIKLLMTVAKDNLKKKESEKHSIDLENKSENNLENKNINPKEKNTIS